MKIVHKKLGTAVPEAPHTHRSSTYTQDPHLHMYVYPNQ